VRHRKYIYGQHPGLDDNAITRAESLPQLPYFTRLLSIRQNGVSAPPVLSLAKGTVRAANSYITISGHSESLMWATGQVNAPDRTLWSTAAPGSQALTPAPQVAASVVAASRSDPGSLQNADTRHLGLGFCTVCTRLAVHSGRVKADRYPSPRTARREGHRQPDTRGYRAPPANNHYIPTPRSNLLDSTKNSL
jgi:hypothetical protein